MKWRTYLLIGAILSLLYGTISGDSGLHATLSLIMFYLASKEEN